MPFLNFYEEDDVMVPGCRSVFRRNSPRLIFLPSLGKVIKSENEKIVKNAKALCVKRLSATEFFCLPSAKPLTF